MRSSSCRDSKVGTGLYTKAAEFAHNVLKEGVYADDVALRRRQGGCHIREIESPRDQGTTRSEKSERSERARDRETERPRDGEIGTETGGALAVTVGRTEATDVACEEILEVACVDDYGVYC